ncbi:cation transporter [Meridianimarinicoccus roseus]|uniref:Cation transporter n=1 Tax=Meridianimarinicoccus roseus TaxID=2072018 RepID=A0A2V2LEI1_9RHOB|nr:cation diffusion facilitator family transporter [Meridianimarinicoccus roseus]PWR03970.1 cation transporter [Meridianimarinicoccus roseus]
MSRGHGHHHHKGHSHHLHLLENGGDRRVAWAVAANVLLTAGQIAGGIVSGSIALIADAIHNLSDAMTLVIALVARRIARRPSDATMTFGYGRAETVAALVNYTTLILISLYLAYEAVWRLLDPTQITGWIVIAVAGLALAVDVLTAMLTYSMSKDSLNIRAAFLHNMADAGTSVAVILGGVLVMLFDWRLVDPLLTLGISGYILWHALTDIGPVIRILMLGVPPGVDPHEVARAVRGVAGVAGVHNIYLWQIDERRFTLQAHLVLHGATDEAEARRAVRALLAREFRLGQVTLETERAEAGCANPALIGSGAG